MSQSINRSSPSTPFFVFAICLSLVAGCTTASTTWKKSAPVKPVDCMHLQMRIGPFEGPFGSWIQPTLYADAERNAAEVFTANKLKFCGVSMGGRANQTASHILSIQSTTGMTEVRESRATIYLDMELREVVTNEPIWKGKTTAVVFHTKHNDNWNMKMLLLSGFRLLNKEGFITLPNGEFQD